MDGWEISCLCPLEERARWQAGWAWCVLMPGLRSQLVLLLLVQSLRLCWSPAAYKLSHKCSWQYPLGKCWQADSTSRDIFFNGLVIKCIKIHQQTTSLSMLENSLFSDFSLPCSLWGYSYKTGYEMLPAQVVIHGWKWPHGSEGRRIKVSQRWLCARRHGICARQAMPSLLPPLPPEEALILSKNCAFSGPWVFLFQDSHHWLCCEFSGS